MVRLVDDLGAQRERRPGTHHLGAPDAGTDQEMSWEATARSTGRFAMPASSAVVLLVVMAAVFVAAFQETYPPNASPTNRSGARVLPPTI